MLMKCVYNVNWMVYTACPRLNGLMSRKASVFSVSKSFIEGISPSGVVSMIFVGYIDTKHTLDDLAEET